MYIPAGIFDADTIMLVALSGHSPDHARWDISFLDLCKLRSGWVGGSVQIRKTVCKKIRTLTLIGNGLLHFDVHGYVV